MKETEFLRKRNVIPKDGTDLIIGFDNGTKESLIGLLKEYHESELKKLRVTDVSICSCGSTKYYSEQYKDITKYYCSSCHEKIESKN